MISSGILGSNGVSRKPRVVRVGQIEKMVSPHAKVSVGGLGPRIGFGIGLRLRLWLQVGEKMAGVGAMVWVRVSWDYGWAGAGVRVVVRGRVRVGVWIKVVHRVGVRVVNWVDKVFSFVQASVSVHLDELVKRKLAFAEHTGKPTERRKQLERQVSEQSDSGGERGERGEVQAGGGGGESWQEASADGGGRRGLI